MPLAGRAQEQEALLECPHDRQPMSALEVDGVTVDRCGACGGTWFDARELRRVARDADVERLATRIPVNGLDSPFRCPRCGGRCVEGHVEAVEVDHCLECQGVWLDRGELAEAVRAARGERRAQAVAGGFRNFLSRL